MPEIDILLASYNGEKFIAEQLDSLLAQTFKDFRVIIRDDGSTDRTPEIIADYEARYPGIIEAVHDDVTCRSATKNFFQLMKYAKADYIMFCDQDDYWLPYKIQVSLWHMKEAERRNTGKPVLIFSGLNVTDENLNSMNRFLQFDIESSQYKNFRNLILSNTVSGCTSIINRPLYEMCSSWEEGMPFAYDSMIAVLASLCGVIEHIPAAMVLYRQHKNNTSGYMGVGGGGGYFSNWVKKVWRLGRSFHIKRKSEFLFENYRDIIPPEKYKELGDFLAFINKNRIAKFFMLLFGRGYNIEGRLFCRIKYFLRLVLS